MVMFINELKAGQSAIITKINNNSNPAYVEELNALGLCEGVKVTCIRKSILKRLLHIKCHNSVVVVRKKEAGIIEVGDL